MKHISTFTTRNLSSRSKLKRHRIWKLLRRRIERHTTRQEIWQEQEEW